MKQWLKWSFYLLGMSCRKSVKCQPLCSENGPCSWRGNRIRIPKPKLHAQVMRCSTSLDTVLQIYTLTATSPRIQHELQPKGPGHSKIKTEINLNQPIQSNQHPHESINKHRHPIDIYRFHIKTTTVSPHQKPHKGRACPLRLSSWVQEETIDPAEDHRSAQDQEGIFQIQTCRFLKFWSTWKRKHTKTNLTGYSSDVL